MSFQVPIYFDDDKENCLLATPDKVSTPDSLSAKPSSSQNSCGSSPCLRRSTVPFDLSMLSAARTCSELETERTFPESWNQKTAACTRTPGDKASASFYFILPLNPYRRRGFKTNLIWYFTSFGIAYTCQHVLIHCTLSGYEATSVWHKVRQQMWWLYHLPNN